MSAAAGLISTGDNIRSMSLNSVSLTPRYGWTARLKAAIVLPIFYQLLQYASPNFIYERKLSIRNIIAHCVSLLHWSCELPTCHMVCAHLHTLSYYSLIHTTYSHLTAYSFQYPTASCTALLFWLGFFFITYTFSLFTSISVFEYMESVCLLLCICMFNVYDIYHVISQILCGLDMVVMACSFMTILMR